MTRQSFDESEHVETGVRNVGKRFQHLDGRSGRRRFLRSLSTVPAILASALAITSQANAQTPILYDAFPKRPLLEDPYLKEAMKKIVVKGGPHAEWDHDMSIVEEIYNIYEAEPVDDVGGVSEFELYDQGVSDFFGFPEYLLEKKVIGNFKCDQYRNVSVEVVIGGGAKRNAVQGVAWCGTQKVVGSGSVYDPGKVTVTGTTVNGVAACSARELRQLNPKSNWTVTCTYF